MAIIGTLTMAGGSYFAIQRDDTKEVRDTLNAHDRLLAVHHENISRLIRESEERAREERQHRRETRRGE